MYYVKVNAGLSANAFCSYKYFLFEFTKFIHFQANAMRHPNKARSSAARVYAYLSKPTNWKTPPFLVSTSKSNDLVVAELRAKFTELTSSKRTWMGGLCTNMKPRSSG